MLKFSLIGAALIAITVVIHAYGTTRWIYYLGRHFVGPDGKLQGQKSLRILISTGLIMVLLHVVQIVLWAVTYRVLLPAGELETFETAVYFSFVTFTTLGYGDITLSEGVRILSGIEAMNGILLVGWSTAVLFAVVQRVWQSGISRRQDP
jgi:voltage-gated potassium channel Kch